MMLAHTIEAVVDGRITRVHCNTCGGRHAYRPNAPGTGGGSRTRMRSTRGASTRTVPAEVRYADLLRGRDSNGARAYSSTERFAVDELIRHPSFGLGVVTALKDVNKIEVLFADGAKVLIHRRG